MLESSSCLICRGIKSQDLVLRRIFDQVSQYWAPKPKSRKSLDETNETADDEPAGEECEVTPRDPYPAPVEDGLEELLDEGTRTPDSKPALNDEHLAWTLGGAMRKTASLGTIWQSPEEATHQDMSEMDLEDRIKQLEYLDGNQVCMLSSWFGNLMVFCFYASVAKAPNGRAANCHRSQFCPSELGKHLRQIRKMLFCKALIF